MSPGQIDAPDDCVAACPHCDVASLRRLTRDGGGRPPTHDKPYKCSNCLEPVAEPNFRPPKNGRPTKHRLTELDPDDIPALADDGGSA
jgi:hypothetical protein